MKGNFTGFGFALHHGLDAVEDLDWVELGGFRQQSLSEVQLCLDHHRVAQLNDRVEARPPRSHVALERLGRIASRPCRRATLMGSGRFAENELKALEGCSQIVSDLRLVSLGGVLVVQELLLRRFAALGAHLVDVGEAWTKGAMRQS